MLNAASICLVLLAATRAPGGAAGPGEFVGFELELEPEVYLMAERLKNEDQFSAVMRAAGAAANLGHGLREAVAWALSRADTAGLRPREIYDSLFARPCRVVSAVYGRHRAQLETILVHSRHGDPRYFEQRAAADRLQRAGSLCGRLELERAALLADDRSLFGAAPAKAALGSD